MKRILSLFACLVTFAVMGTPSLAHAQAQTFPQSTYNASSYGSWLIQSQQANTYQFSPVSYCQVPQQGGGLFVPFATNAPIYIADSTSANSEVVTPSSVITGSAYCGVVVSPANQHYTFSMRSGTGGLQEALNALAIPTTAYPATIVLDRNWYANASVIPGTTSAAILTAAKGNAHAFLEDITAAGPTFYVWNGTSYVSGTWTNVKPTAAAGAAAGTSPTISDAGSALATTVLLNEGTAPTTGVLFTLTWASTGQFSYAPTGCTVTSNGANSFAAFTVAATGGNPAVLTVTATAAPAASTAYSFNVTGCK